MIGLLLLVQAAELPDCKEIASQKISPQKCISSATISLRAIDPAAAIAEFKAVCIDTDGNAEKVWAAAEASKLHYEADPPPQLKLSQRWTAKQASIALETPKEPAMSGYRLPQCLLTVGIVEPWTERQFIAEIKRTIAPGIDVPLWDGITEMAVDNTTAFFEWVSDRPDVRNRVTVWAFGKAKQSVTLVFEKWSPEGLRQSRIDDSLRSQGKAQ